MGARGGLPVRAIEPQSDGASLSQSITGPFAAFIPRLEAAARACIADGAEVILVGCGYYGPLLRSSGYLEVAGTGMPVLDSSAIGIKYLEAMTDSAQTCGCVKSSRHSFRAPDSDALERSRHSLGLV